MIAVLSFLNALSTESVQLNGTIFAGSVRGFEIFEQFV